MNKIAIIGDYQENYRPHDATNEAIVHAASFLEEIVSADWIPTASIDDNFNTIITTYQGFWIAPGSPYNSMSGALKIIKYAREKGIPTIGTCGGFQHMVIEYARNILGITDAEHAEYNPYASTLIVNPLQCSLAGQTLEIELKDKVSKTYQIFNQDTITEKYYCNFGLNPKYQQEIHNSGFKVTGTDSLQEARILELEDHPFFIATLFIPQDNSTLQKPHPLVTAFLKSVIL